MDQRIDILFEHLEKYKKLPSYQLERRVDIFFAIYLKEILEARFGAEIDAIIPEFPLMIQGKSRVGNPVHLSNKVDFLAISKDKKLIFLVELKTEIKSVNAAQVAYLKYAREIGLHMILSNLKSIYTHSDQKVKYNALYQMIDELGWIDQNKDPISDIGGNIRIVFVIPAHNTKTLSQLAGFECITFDDIITILENHEDILTKRFMQALDKWKLNF